jgi:predicted RNA-binding protein associated with RNAse of E/G family
VRDDVTKVEWDGRKWPDQVHWQYALRRLGRDEHGVWLYAPPDTVVQRGEEPPRGLEAGFVALVPEDAWWTAEFYWDHPWLAVYVNIGTPCEWDGDRVTQIDLDLDVVRLLDGSVKTIDEDEFADHQIRYDYPQELVDAARRAANETTRMLEEGVEPFGVAANHWIDLVLSS